MKPHSGTLLINIINEESGGKAELYEGVYQCTARNVLGAAISNNIVIRASRKFNINENFISLQFLQIVFPLCLKCLLLCNRLYHSAKSNSYLRKNTVLFVNLYLKIKNIFNFV